MSATVRTQAFEPIITSLLDNDYYVFTMGQFAWRYHRTLRVPYGFTNRSKDVKLAQHIDLTELARQIEAVRKLRFTTDELDYLRAQKCFSEGYLTFLSKLKLPAVTIGEDTDGQLTLSYGSSATWAGSILWESVLLSLVNQLYYARIIPGHHGAKRGNYAVRGLIRLAAKAHKLSAHPNIRFIEFGTRRRFSRAWQQKTTEYMQVALPNQLIGTSNVALARELHLPPSGTMAHQLFMVLTALRLQAGDANPIASAQKLVLDGWEELYADYESGRLLVFLPDTYTTEYFLANLEPERLERWKAFRQDSGDPVEEGKLIIAFLRQHGYDPSNFRLIPSDGLTVDTMIHLHESLGGIINLVFGWGTNLTNDLGPAALSMVIKPSEGAKVSNNRAKACGPAAVLEALLTHIHVPDFDEATVY